MSAGTAASILTVGSENDGLPEYRVVCLFEHNRSWTKDTTSHQLLKHEQIHFNIAELFSRKIRNGVDSLRNQNIQEFEPYDAFINQKFDERDQYDLLFDKQTSYAINIKTQDDWFNRVESQLTTLQKYSSDLDEYGCQL